MIETLPLKIIFLKSEGHDFLKTVEDYFKNQGFTGSSGIHIYQNSPKTQVSALRFVEVMKLIHYSFFAGYHILP